MPPQRSGAQQAPSLRLPTTFPARARSLASTAQRRRGKRPAATRSTGSQDSCATDRHLQGYDPRTHGGTQTIYRVRNKCRKHPDQSALLARSRLHDGRRQASAWRWPTRRRAGILPGWPPGRSGRSGPVPEGRRSPTRSSLAGPVVPPSRSVATLQKFQHSLVLLLAEVHPGALIGGVAAVGQRPGTGHPRHRAQRHRGAARRCTGG